jgi:phage N-6-adenine-methyltransferase
MLISDIRTDGGTQSRDSLDAATAEEYANAMTNGAAFPAVVVFYDGQAYWLADGFHRVAAAKQAGLTQIDADIRQGSRRDAILLSVGANSSHGLRRTNTDKRRAVMTLLSDEEWSKWANVEIARRCAVSEGLVRIVRDAIFVNTKMPTDRTVERGGKVYQQNTANIGRTPAPSRAPAPTPARPESWQPPPPRQAAWEPPPSRQVEQDDWRDDDLADPVATSTVMPAVHNHRAQGTGENEWYTPPDYIERARAVLGAFDLDPASSEQANKTVKSAQFFTVEDDGLQKEWHGRVWLNPPYSQPHIAQFMEKMASEYKSGRVKEAIVLTHNYTDTAWFHTGAKSCKAICFTRGRIGFLSPEGKRAAPTQGQAFFYYGENPRAFAEHFASIGFIVEGFNG